MNTPICDFVRAYAGREVCRLHMPGHKGHGPLGVEALDITEIGGADVLYHGAGIICQSQANAARLFGTAKSLYSTEGSSLAIRAMLCLAAMYGRERGLPPRIAAGRNAHKVFMTAAGLLDLEVDWLYPERRDCLLSCAVTPEALEAYLSAVTEKPAAVYVTSPDYLGEMADIAGLSAVCRRHGTLLLVDNAHGAYLRFLPQSRHPMTLGADLCCDSAHKTLPVLTGGAYLHISPQAPALLAQRGESAMALFASTSPSYLILQSLDAVNPHLAGDYPRRLTEFAGAVAALKERLGKKGWTLAGEEPLKLTLMTRPKGYLGTELAEILEGQGLVSEFADPDYVVFMVAPGNGEEALTALERALDEVKPRVPLPGPDLPVCRPRRRLSIRAAMLGARETLPLDRCKGRVLASATVSCPPAIPVVVCGEEIDEAAMAWMEYYGVTTCEVVK